MKQKIEKLLTDVAGLMQKSLSKADFDSVTRLSTTLSRLQLLQKRVVEVEGEILELESTVKALHGKNISHEVEDPVHEPAYTNVTFQNHERSGPQTLRFEIDWKANRRNREKELIFLPVAADGLVKFLSRIREEFGQEVLEKLARLKINRAFLLSKNPTADFLNRSQGTIYGHKKLPGTEYFVMTHSSTTQKIEDVYRICRAVGFVSGSVQVSSVSRADCYSSMY